MCVGNPGAFDLEQGDGTDSTEFDPPVFHTSAGTIVNVSASYVAKGLGALRHSAWTYWGHSGAPLLSVLGDGGRVGVCGLHSSWNDANLARHGVPGDDIARWLAEGGWLG